MLTPHFADKTIWNGNNLDNLRGMNNETVDLMYLDSIHCNRTQWNRPRECLM